MKYRIATLAALISLSVTADDLGDHGRRHIHTTAISAVSGTPALAVNVLDLIDTAGNVDARDLAAEPVAFPGATGFAKYATGGRGAPIYAVNTLQDIVATGDGLISWREAWECRGDVPSGPRNIVFDVGGVFEGGLDVDSAFNVWQTINDGCGNVSVYCHTAPSPGVVFAGSRPFSVRGDADNGIVRFCRSRPMDQYTGNDSQRSMTFAGNVTSPDNWMINHVSAGWSTDDGISTFTGQNSPDRNPSKTFTISQTIMGDGDTTCLRPGDNECGSSASSDEQQSYFFPNHSVGAHVAALSGKSAEDYAFAGNLFLDTVGRAPQFRGVDGGEIVNNFIANYFNIGINYTAVIGGAANRGWLINNTFKEGPSTVQNDDGLELTVSGGQYVINSNRIIHTDGTIESIGDDKQTHSELPNNTRSTLDGHAEFDIKCVGASVPVRDSVDAINIANINGIGTDPMLPESEIGIGQRIPWDTGICGPEPGQPGNTQAYCFYEPGVNDQGQRQYNDYWGPFVDTDNDLVPDSFEQQAITDLANADDLTDVTHRTIAPDGESYFGKWTQSQAIYHPDSYDTDGDNIPDAFEQQWIASGVNDQNGDPITSLADIDATTLAAPDFHYTVFERHTQILAASCAQG